MRKFLVAIAILSFTLLALASCSGGDNDNADYGKSTVYTKGTNVQIVSVDSAGSAVAEELADTLGQMINDGGSSVTSGSIYSENQRNEIILGYLDESRPATVKAYKVLDRMEKDSYFEARVAVYAESGCIAFAYDRNEYTNIQAIGYAVQDFIKEFITDKGYIAFAEGTVYTNTYNLIDLQDKLDLIKEGEEWAALAEAAGEVFIIRFFHNSKSLHFYFGIRTIYHYNIISHQKKKRNRYFKNLQIKYIFSSTRLTTEPRYAKMIKSINIARDTRGEAGRRIC